MHSRYKAARVDIRVMHRKIWVADYSGPIDRHAANALSRYERDFVNGESSIQRVDRALLCTNGDDLNMDHLHGSKPCAVICRDDQVQATDAYCAIAAKAGVIRLCFLDPEQAFLWVSAIALRH